MPTYIAINASAGSGKTYTLVQRILMLCLKTPHQPDSIKHILALTFTNKAANEMKERILLWLKNFSSEDYADNNDLISIQKIFEEEGICLSIDELHRRSKAILDYILHHYSTLNIETIDKFNSRLVRSFSYELGLAQNFNLEIKTEPYLAEAVDEVLSKIGENGLLSETFLDYIHYNLENERKENIAQTLLSSSKDFISDIHHQRLLENKNFDWEKYKTAKEILRKEIASLKQKSLKLTDDSLQTIQEKGLGVADFSGGNSNSIAKFFQEFQRYATKKRIDFPFPSSEEKALLNYQKGASTSGKNKEAAVLEMLDFLIKNREIIVGNHIAIQKKEKLLKSLLPLKINKEIQDQLAIIEEENDLVLLSKFNVLINENLKNEPSNFIYEKVGTRFRHYFFDEFQDTSFMQWDNFLPLRDHTISSENSSFTIVGDPKQNIYRFRGGESQIMLDIINKKEKSLIPAKTINLDKNYRSAKNIVSFNNDLYKYISQFLNEEHSKIFHEGAFQYSVSENLGRVRINLIENERKSETFYTESASQMQKDIQECLDNGYNFSDITLLCRGKKDILNFTRFLSNLKVNYKNESSYIKVISENGLTLNLCSTINAVIQFLLWNLYPKNKRFLVLMFYYLSKTGRIQFQDFSKEIAEILENDDVDSIKKAVQNKFNLNLTSTGINLNLYNFVEHFTGYFSVQGKETDYILSFLEMTYNFSQKVGANIKDFLKYWEEEGKDTTVQSSENVDAIKIMTIHKSKGLEFPIVFLPMQNKLKDDFNEWFSVDGIAELQSVNLSGFDKKLENYDAEIQEFNQTNFYKNKIDRTSLLYVATTRAVDQLFLYLQKPGSKNHLEIYDCVMQKNDNQQDSFDYFEDFSSVSQKKESKTNEGFLAQSVSINSKKEEKPSNIKIATPSKTYQQRNDKVRLGILTHEILSKIYFKKDVALVLQKYLLEGIITENELGEISHKIHSVIDDKNYSEYFDENTEIINERDIFISEGKEIKVLRIDRLINTKNGYMIVDFKTGEKTEKHQKQIEGYKTALESFGKTVLKTEVIYL